MSTTNLRAMYEHLTVRGEACGVPWHDAALAGYYRGSYLQFDRLLDGASESDATEALRILRIWARLILDKKAAMKRDRGVSPKSAAPSRTAKVVADSVSEVVGLSQIDQAVILQAHNAARARHGAQALTYDNRLEAHAQHWANHVATLLAQSWEIDRSKIHNANRTVDGLEGSTGENIYRCRGSGGRPVIDHERPVTSWVDEANGYDFVRHCPKPGSKPGTVAVTGHFTQVVWKRTTRMGCGFTLIEQSGARWFAVWVCNYHPGANVEGQFAANVSSASHM